MQSISGSNPVILVVDDARVANSLALVLQASGYAPVVAGTGRAALEAISGNRPDIAIIDIQLPDTDGIRVAREIGSTLPECKILLATGYPESAHLLEEAKKNGLIFPVLPKPIALRELLRTIGELLHDRRTPAA